VKLSREPPLYNLWHPNENGKRPAWRTRVSEAKLPRCIEKYIEKFGIRPEIEIIK